MLLAKQLEVLYNQWSIGALAALSAAAILVGILWQEAPPQTLLVWFAVIVMVSAARFGLVLMYSRSAAPQERSAYWLRLFIAGTVASGIVWGSCLLTLIPSGSIFHAGLAALWLCGLTAGSVASLSVLKRVYFAFTFPALFPGALHLVLSDRPDENILGTALFLFLGFISLTSLRMHRTLSHTLMTQIDNARLLSELAIEKEQLEDFSRELEARVSHRTAKLQSTNKQLKLEISERSAAENALRLSEERYRSLYNDNPIIMFTVDARWTVLSVNQFGADQLGYTASSLVGTPILDLCHESDREAMARAMKECLDNSGDVRRHEFRKLRRNGTPLWVRESFRTVTEPSGKSVLIAGEDITESRSLSKELAYQASHDPLTGLVNRREFHKRLHRLLQSSGESETKNTLCYMDLDQFKIVNDICGHRAGDELLRQLSQLLQTQVRKRDTLARLGGDEFGVLMEHCSLEQAQRVASTIVREIRDFRFHCGERTFSIGVSIGLVSVTDAFAGVADIQSQADAACYMAKNAGGGRIYTYAEDDAALLERHGEMQWATRVNEAFEQERFRLSLQPIVPVDETSSKGVHVEVLLRMQGDSAAAILAGDFLPAAERYGLARRIDSWVVDTVFTWLSKQPTERFFSCGINLSGHSLVNEDFLSFVLRRLEETKIPAEKICFEITETAAIANLAFAKKFIHAIREKGCRFALDDFGTGLSSFAYLRNLPVDFVKIDGVFVKNITHSSVDFAMVKSINEIGQILGKLTVAEFVEDLATLEKLAEIGVDYAQGYYIGRPQPLEDFVLHTDGAPSTSEKSAAS